MSHLPAEVLGVLGTAEGWVIREDLTAWEQVQDQGHPHARMALMWRLHGFREALWTTVNPKTVTLPCKVGGSVSFCPSTGQLGHHAGQDCSLLPAPCAATRSGPWGCCRLGPAHCYGGNKHRGVRREHSSLHSREKFLGER